MSSFASSRIPHGLSRFVVRTTAGTDVRTVTVLAPSRTLAAQAALRAHRATVAPHVAISVEVVR